MNGVFEIGDIVKCPFPSNDGSEIGLHFCLVLKIDKDNRYLTVAFGTSKQADSSCPLPGEVIISDSDDLLACGLSIKTRFVLSRCYQYIKVENAVLKGKLPQHKYKQLIKAITASNAIRFL
jgi:PemK-like, MazF-like toxin of type II toxin-antitoxin system